MDLQMPIMDGFEATQLIREFDQDVPIIAITQCVCRCGTTSKEAV